MTSLQSRTACMRTSAINTWLAAKSYSWARDRHGHQEQEMQLLLSFDLVHLTRFRQQQLKPKQDVDLHTRGLAAVLSKMQCLQTNTDCSHASMLANGVDVENLTSRPLTNSAGLGSLKSDLHMYDGNT